jgi:predicted site-specific integrase-resolvase
MKNIVTLQNREYVSRKVVLDLFGIEYLTLMRWDKNGVLPDPIKLGKRLYYDRDELERRLANRAR